MLQLYSENKYDIINIIDKKKPSYMSSKKTVKTA